jgi:hypothetical protein
MHGKKVDGGGLGDEILVQNLERGGTGKSRTSWALEVYRGTHDEERVEPDGEEDMMELDLEEEGAEFALKFITIGVYYSQKSYNPWFLFTDMLTAWGIKKIGGVEKLGDYCFKLEFEREEEKIEAIEGGGGVMETQRRCANCCPL